MSEPNKETFESGNNGKSIEIIAENGKKLKLNLRQEKFCELYCSQDSELFGNGVQAYIEAYEPDQTKPNWYKSVCAASSRLLSQVKVIERINQILEETGFNDAFIDKQLSFLITQHADFQSKLGAIKEYNKLKGRIVEKSLNLHAELPKPIYGSQSVQNDEKALVKGEQV